MYTLIEAAKVVGKSKAALSKAIRAGKLVASKGSGGRYVIDPVELHKVYPVTEVDDVVATEARVVADPEGKVVDKVNTRPGALAEPVVDAGDAQGCEDVSRASVTEVDDVVATEARVVADPEGKVVDKVNTRPGAAMCHDTPSDDTADDTAPCETPGAHPSGDGAPDSAASEAANRMLRAQIDRLIAELDRERAHSREVVDRIGRLEAAGPAPRLRPPMSNPETGAVSPGSPSPEQMAQDGLTLGDLRSDIADMRAALVYSVQQVNATLTARPGFLGRSLLALPVAWCVLSGVYVAGFFVAFGPNEFWRVGQLSLGALIRMLLSYWPF